MYIFIVVYTYTRGDARDVIDIVIGNGHSNKSSILDKAVCISHSTNTLGKGMNPTILRPAMGKIIG